MNIRSFPQNPTSIFFTCRQLLVGLESRKWCYSKVKSLKVLFQRSQTFFKCYLTMLVSRLINWVVFFGNLWHRKYQRSKCIMAVYSLKPERFQTTHWSSFSFICYREIQWRNSSFSNLLFWPTIKIWASMLRSNTPLLKVWRKSEEISKKWLDTTNPIHVSLMQFEKKESILNDQSLKAVHTMPQCLKITEKVSFNSASKASYLYILYEKKVIKNTKNWSILLQIGFWVFGIGL